MKVVASSIEISSSTTEIIYSLNILNASGNCMAPLLS
jgi:hypothetical protein